jgi:hypothetical protein
MITVAFSDACTELLEGDWQAACRELTTLDGAMLAAVSLHFDRPVSELYRIVDKMFNAAPLDGDDFATSRSSTTDFGAEERSTTFDLRQQVPHIAARWQDGFFPLMPLMRDEERPLREALPPRSCRSGTGAPDPTLELFVTLPLIGGGSVSHGTWTTSAGAVHNEATPKSGPVKKAAAKKARPVRKMV